LIYGKSHIKANDTQNLAMHAFTTAKREKLRESVKHPIRPLTPFHDQNGKTLKTQIRSRHRRVVK
jgi:hypothetical protein